MSALKFEVTGAQAKQHVAIPSIAFRIRVTAGERIEALVLRAQLRIEPQWREYREEEQALLNDLFGTPERWNTTLRPLSWADVPLVVTAFDGETQAGVTVPCTYDFDLAASRFLNALDGGDIPVRFLFSGAIFRDGTQGFVTERVSWSSECAYRMPLDVWHQAMRACYGDSALIRVSRDTLARLQRYRALSGTTNWDELLERLMGAPT